MIKEIKIWVFKLVKLDYLHLRNYFYISLEDHV